MKPAPTNSLRPMPACNPLPEPFLSASTGDYDGDGKSDILWRNSSATAGTQVTLSAEAMPGDAGRSISQVE